MTNAITNRKENEVAQRPLAYANLDLYETGGEFFVLIDMPGLEAGNVDVRYEDGLLTIEGRIADAGADRPALHTEYRRGDFRRQLKVGDGVDVERITASYEDGVLKLTLPKVDAAKVRKIPLT